MRKVSLKSAYKTQIQIGIPISICFMALVIGSQVALQYFNLYFTEQTESGEYNDYYIYIPGLINVIFMSLFGIIYRKLCDYLIQNENHPYMNEQEDSIINKTYMFQFINTYIYIFVDVFYYQDWKRLQQNLFIVMVFKQVFMNIFEYLMLKCTVARSIKKVKNMFKKRKAILDDELKELK